MDRRSGVFSSAVKHVTVLGAMLTMSLAATTPSCTRKEPGQDTYFDRSIAPILKSSCVNTNTGAGCHVSNAKGNAFGNLDLATFAAVDKRRDLLVDYGPYGQQAMLVKSVAPYQLRLQMFDGVEVNVLTDIKHTGGAILDTTGSAYQTLRKWMDNGATANNAGPSLEQQRPNGRCSTSIPAEAGFDPNKAPTEPDFAEFKSSVAPMLKGSCASTNCHGSLANELYLTCGDDEQQIRWNYHAATQYLAQTPEQSEMARRPLAPSQGGAFHEGGVIFQTRSDDGYQRILKWATAHGPPKFENLEPNFLFFAHRVQPMLAKKGCMMMQCHSAAMFHDYRLRGGSGGSFSLSASRRNYELSLDQMALESSDPNASRLVRKNLFRPEVFPTAGGLAHRGGPLLEDFPGQSATPAACAAGNYDYDNGDLDRIPAYCMIAEWLKRERAARTLAPLSGVVYVKRAIPAGPDRAQDFDVYAPGSDLRILRVTQGPSGELVPGADQSVTAGCGLSVATADIKRPAVSWDGSKIAFAARSSANEPLAIYEMNADGSSCAKHPEINAGPTSGNGLLIHNFDPQYSPPDANGKARIVFASTRGPTFPAGPDAFDYTGPQRTPADPSKPNANLYVFEPNPKGGGNRVRQLTFQLNLERYPSFMNDGRVIFTTEKRAPGFYQLALRRQNLDGGDYHPLFAQRSSVGHNQATYVVELADKNFAAIFSDLGMTHQGGALGIFNRSIGVDFRSTNPEDYPLDPTVIDPNGPMTPEPSFFLRSLSFVEPAASGRVGSEGTGAFTSPAPLPSNKMLVSWGINGDYDVYVLDTVTLQRSKLIGDPGQAEIEAVGIYGREPRRIFQSRADEPNGHTEVFEGRPEADILVNDMPMLASLLFQNTPTGRQFVRPDANPASWTLLEFPSFEVWEDLPPPPEVTSFAQGGSSVVDDKFGKVWVKRRQLGNVGIASDGSAAFRFPGGVPIVLKIPDPKNPQGGTWQREAMSFYPGEYAHQSFRRQFFDSLCGHCHGAVSGRPLDVALRPDVLTQASAVQKNGAGPDDLYKGPGSRAPVITGGQVPP